MSFSNPNSQRPDQTPAPANLPSSRSETAATYLDSGPSVFDEDPKTSGIWRRLNNSALHESALRKRAEILSLPSDESNIDTSRVDAYCDSVGIPRTALRFLATADYLRAREIAGVQAGDDIYGSYLGLPDIDIVERNPRLEELNGPEVLERIAIHERVHAGSKPKFGNSPSLWANLMRLAVGAQLLRDPTRMGFHRTNQYGGSTGLFLEEGLAEYMAGQYVVHVLNRPNGFAPPLEGAFAPFNKYRFLDRTDTGEVIAVMTPGANGAVVIEELVQLDPEILPLIRSCRGDHSKIPELSARLDVIRPGLYEQLSDIGLGHGAMYSSVEPGTPHQ